MTTLTVAADVRAAFDQLHTAAVTVDGLDNTGRWPEVEVRLAAVERDPAGLGDDDPHAKAITTEIV